MAKPNLAIGVALALVCLLLLGVLPVVANSRPAGTDALTFALFLSVWQVAFALPLLAAGPLRGRPGILAADLPPGLRRRTLGVILLTGAIFGLSTLLYVVSVEKAGAVSAAIAMQAYPLFAIAMESLFLKQRKTVPELALTGVMLVALTHLATAGTWRVAGFSPWFLAALAVPFLWSIAHIIIREALGRTPITPAQVTFFRVLVSTLFLGGVTAAMGGPDPAWADRDFQAAALLMGLVYYLELVFWFHALRHITVSLASTITVPWPALTMVLAILFLEARVEAYQIIAFAVVAASIYGLLFLEARKGRGG
ncbi:MAG: DMT family transporter [Rhodobacterales bacterium]|nr:DMT family transporter [Rhodobacterales bacterium]